MIIRAPLLLRAMLRLVTDQSTFALSCTIAERERVAEGDCIVQHVPSANNLADMFTKALNGPKVFKTCVGLKMCVD